MLSITGRRGEADVAATILYCTRRDCRAGYASLGEVPRICPACQQDTRWTTVAPIADHPNTPFRVNINDRRFLRSLRISSEDLP